MAAVSVIVPARNASATLPAALRALTAQTFAEEVEIVVVDDHSTDDTPDLARAAGARVVTTDEPRGAGHARNTGMAATLAPLIAFTDADCEPAPDWLTHGVAALRDGADLVQGRILPTEGATVGPFDRTLRVEGPSPLYETANLFVRREAVERAGGFPARLDGVGEAPFGEDTAFAWAVRRAGARARYVPEALVRHAVFPRDARGYVAERRRLRLFPTLMRQVPELRGELVGGVFLSRRTAAFDLAVAGVAAALLTRRAWPLLLAAPYLREVPPPVPPERWSVHAWGAAVAADAVGAQALARGSAEARTLVL